jgi:hypothetical protein
MKFGSVFSGLLAIAAPTLATHADIVYSGPINATVTQDSPYILTITEGGSTHQWIFQNYSSAAAGYSGDLYINSSISATSEVTRVAESNASQAQRFEFESSIGPTSLFGNWTRELRSLYTGLYSGNFPVAPSTTQYAGFSFVGLDGTAFYGWVGLTIRAEDFVVNSFAYSNGPIGAGMTIPAPGAIALLGLVGLVGGRRRA